MVFCRDKKKAQQKFKDAGVDEGQIPTITAETYEFTNFVGLNTNPVNRNPRPKPVGH